MRKFFTVLLIGFLMSGFLFTVLGCKKQQAPVLSSVSQALPSDSRRLANGDVTFTVFIGDLNNLVSSYDYKDNLFTQKITDETGINLEIVATTGASASERLNVLLNTGDYTDLIIKNYASSQVLTMAEMVYYASEGIYISLDEYDPMSFPNIKRAFDLYPAFNDMLRSGDGKLYGLPAANEAVHTRFSNNQHLYYQPFMHKYERDTGRGIPETLDDFTTYLRWIRDTDVNENGNRNDEIPLAFAVNSIRVFVDTFAKCYMPFVYANSHFGLAREGRQVVEQYKDPRYREALRYMAQLYSERLVYPDSFTQPQQALQALATADTPVLATVTGGGANNQGTNYYYHARWLPILKGPYGDQHSYDEGPWRYLGASMFVTDKCKDPKLALAFFNYFLNHDVMLDGCFGPKGYGWDDPDPGTLSLIGGPVLYKILKLYGTADLNYTWNQVHPMLRTYEWRYGEQANDVSNIERWLKTGDMSLFDSMKTNPSYNEVKNIIQAVLRIPYETPVERMIPPIPMSDSDAKRVADINVTLNTIIDQAMVGFIVGTRNINNDAVWNAYLADLDRVGSREKATIFEKYLR